MHRTKTSFATTSAASRRDRLNPDARPGRPRRLDPANPESRRVNPSLRAAEFDRFARAIQRDLDPRGPLEHLVARQAIRSAWQLQASLDGVVDPVEEVVPAPETGQAARALEVAITTLDLLRGRRDAEPACDDCPFDLGDELDPGAIEPNEWPILPDDFEPEPHAEAEPEDDAPIWRGRLVFDFDVSDRSPVVKGTWITVAHVVSLIVDGATWADVLRSHPELNEDDVRACVAYAVADDDAEL